MAVPFFSQRALPYRYLLCRPAAFRFNREQYDQDAVLVPGRNQFGINRIVEAEHAFKTAAAKLLAHPLPAFTFGLIFVADTQLIALYLYIKIGSGLAGSEQLQLIKVAFLNDIDGSVT